MMQTALQLDDVDSDDDDLMRAAFRSLSPRIRCKGFDWALNNEAVRRCLVVMVRIKREQINKLIIKQSGDNHGNSGAVN